VISTSEAGSEGMYLMSAQFELGRIPRHVLVRRALDVIPGCFIRYQLAVDVEWELDCADDDASW
jgi:hypothetical protein